MPRGGAAWPQGIRWLAGGLAAVVLVLAVAWVLFVPAADWLARHDVGAAKGPLLRTARDDARGRRDPRRQPVRRGRPGVHHPEFHLVPRRAGDRPIHQGDRAARLGQARRADRRHLRAGARRPGLRERPPHRHGGAHRIHPRALTRRMAAVRPGATGLGPVSPARRPGRPHRRWAAGRETRHPVV